MRRFSLWLPVLAYMGLIFYVSSQSDPLPSVAPLVWDKGVHVAEFGVLAILWCRAFRGEGLGWALTATLALVATVAYGASDEWHQSYVALRSADFHDWFADTIGGSIGLVVYRMARRS